MLFPRRHSILLEAARWGGRCLECPAEVEKVSINCEIKSESLSTYAVTNADVSEIVLAEHPMHEDDENVILILNIRLLRLQKQIYSEICHFLCFRVDVTNLTMFL